MPKNNYLPEYGASSADGKNTASWPATPHDIAPEGQGVTTSISAAQLGGVSARMPDRGRTTTRGVPGKGSASGYSSIMPKKGNRSQKLERLGPTLVPKASLFQANASQVAGQTIAKPGANIRTVRSMAVNPKNENVGPSFDDNQGLDGARRR